MQPEAQAFASLTEKLRDALAASDWEAIADLDEECRGLVAALSDEEAAELQQQLAELSHLYGQLQQSGYAERQRLAGELTRLNQSKHVKNAYKPLG
jgi:metal-responsive CopG/Arc/MetJ family transcriptional regulator